MVVAACMCPARPPLLVMYPTRFALRGPRRVVSSYRFRFSPTPGARFSSAGSGRMAPALLAAASSAASLPARAAGAVAAAAAAPPSASSIFIIPGGASRGLVPSPALHCAALLLFCASVLLEIRQI